MKTTAQVWENRLLWGIIVRIRKADGRLYTRISWKRLLLGFAILCTIGWVSLFSAVYFYFKYGKADFRNISYFETLALPFRLDDHRKRMGDHHIDRGLEALEKGKWAQALRLLRLGLARSSTNIKGRQALVQLYHEGYLQGYFRRETVLSLLENGLPYGKADTGYLRLYFSILFNYEEDEKVIEITQQLLTEETVPTKTERMLALAAASACFHRGRDDEAKAYLRDYQLWDTLDGTLVIAKMGWDRGQREEAIDLLETKRKRFFNAEPLLKLLTDLYLLKGKYPEALKYITLRIANDPTAYKPRLALIAAYHTSGNTSASDREAKTFIRQFNKKPEAMLALSEFAIKTDNVPLAKRLYEIALESAIPRDSLFAVNLVQCVLNTGDHPAVIQLVEDLANENPPWLDATYITPLFNALRYLAYRGQGETALAQSYFTQFFQENLKIGPLRQIAVYFRKNGAQEEALQILLRAYRKDDSREGILTPLIQTELALGRTQNLSEHLEQMLRLRLPSPEALKQTYTQLTKDYFMFLPNRDSILTQMNDLILRYEEPIAGIFPDP